MITLRRSTLAAIAETARAPARREGLRRLRAEHPDATRARSDADLLSVLDAAEALCVREGVLDEGARWSAVELTLTLGAGFEHEPDAYPVHAVLRDPAIVSGDEKIERLHARLSKGRLHTEENER